MLTLSAKSDASRRHAPRKTRRKPRRRRHHRLAVIVQADLPQRSATRRKCIIATGGIQSEFCGSSAPSGAAGGNPSGWPLYCPFGFVVKYPPCLDNRAFGWRRKWCGVRKIGDGSISRCMNTNWRRSRPEWNVADHWAMRLGWRG